MLERLDPRDFDKFYSLIETSFPPDEYKPYSAQKKLLDDPLYSVYVLYTTDREIAACLAVWELGDYLFIEHFAVSPQQRCGGLGARLLAEIAALAGKPLCLEVELPDNELAARRVGFYERNGFFLNSYEYLMPPLAEGREPLPLKIMTTGHSVSEAEFQEIRAKLYTSVYKRSVQH